jgi:phage/plasmid-like protein (TIGR03299 family)
LFKTPTSNMIHLRPIRRFFSGCPIHGYKTMPANFTSGWLGNNEVAWHGLGVVTEGTLPAREAFETADALFTVEKRELQYPVWDYETQFIGVQMSGSYGIVRTDTQALLGVVSKQYEIVQNDSLLRMAEFIREEADMDCVIVLSDGAKVCFTATLRGAETDIVPGDTVKRRIVGYLGHDGKTGCGAKFTNVRVVCQNTLTAALSGTGASSSITHKGTANANFDSLIQSIDVTRQDFATECDLMREFSRFSITSSQFNDFVDEVYNIDEGQAFRKRDKITAAMNRGYGVEFNPGTLWSAYNAITQVETSTRGTTAAKGRAQFARGTFGAGAVISKKAFAIARDLVTAC